MKPLKKKDISKEFFKGNYEFIISQTIDCENVFLPKGEIHWVIGALSFLGRLEEAKKLFERMRETFSLDERIAARFFLAITLTRHAHYEAGRALFKENLRESKNKCSSFGMFFIEQGIGFYRYFSGRPKLAAKRAGRAFSFAMEADFIYGRILSLDLKGHAEVECSEVEVGLSLFNRAKILAKKCGNGSVLQSLENSILLYRLQFGLGGEESIEIVEKKLKKSNHEDTYTESSLLLELSRQFLLRGNQKRAKIVLDRASRVIFSTQNRRHEILLNLRYAELLRRDGDFSQSLNYIRSARTLLHSGIDTILNMEVIESEFKICKALSWKERVNGLKDESLKILKYKTGSVVERSLRRSVLGEINSKVFKYGVDPVGDLLDQLVSKSIDKINEISEDALISCIDFGYFGLLPDALNLKPGFIGMYFDLIPGSVAFFDRGNLLFKKSIPPQTRKLLECLSKKESTKEELIKKIWGYEYHPLRHDALVYQAMNQLRKFLGDYSEWIVSLDSSYRFKKDFSVMSYGGLRVQQSLEDVSVVNQTRSELNLHELNLRQIKIIKIARAEDSLDVRSLVDRLKVSALTISRDFSLLTEKGLLIRIGKGRSTQYIAAEKKLALL